MPERLRRDCNRVPTNPRASTAAQTSGSVSGITLGLTSLLRPKQSGRARQTESVVTERLATTLTNHPASDQLSTFTLWVRDRITQQKVTDDFAEAEYVTLINLATDASRRNLGEVTVEPGLRGAAAALRTSMSQVIHASAPTVEVRGTFDPLIPDVGQIIRSGLTDESRHFIRKKYKASTDKNVETARKHWFTYVLTEANTSPIRPMTGRNFHAMTLEEDLWVNFVSFLARRGIQGDTISGYVSNVKRWHKSATGWDPISSAAVDPVTLSAALAGVRADFPSKQRRRFAHPTRLFKEWWSPLTTPLNQLGGTCLLDQEPCDLTTLNRRGLSTLGQRAVASATRQAIQISGMSADDFKGLVLATTMTAGLLRVSEAIPEMGSEQPPITFDDLVFRWSDDGKTLRYAELWVLPLKKGRQARKVPIKMKYSKGNVRAAHLLWLYSTLRAVPANEKSSTPLFSDFTFDDGAAADSGRHASGVTTKRTGNNFRIIDQGWFRQWYQAKMRDAGNPYWRCYNTHSFRIGGATALLGARVSIERIKAMGRWASDCAEIYTQQTLEGSLELSEQLDLADASPIEDADDSYFDRLTGVSENAADQWAVELSREAEELTADELDQTDEVDL